MEERKLNLGLNEEAMGVCVCLCVWGGGVGYTTLQRGGGGRVEAWQPR